MYAAALQLNFICFENRKWSVFFGTNSFCICHQFNWNKLLAVFTFCSFVSRDHRPHVSHRSRVNITSAIARIPSTVSVRLCATLKVSKICRRQYFAWFVNAVDSHFKSDYSIENKKRIRVDYKILDIDFDSIPVFLFSWYAIWMTLDS